MRLRVTLLFVLAIIPFALLLSDLTGAHLLASAWRCYLVLCAERAVVVYAIHVLLHSYRRYPAQKATLDVAACSIRIRRTGPRPLCVDSDVGAVRSRRGTAVDFAAAFPSVNRNNLSLSASIMGLPQTHGLLIPDPHPSVPPHRAGAAFFLHHLLGSRLSQ